MEPPWLLITDGSHNEKQYLYNISDNRYHRLDGFPEFHDMKVIASAYGWLVLVNHKTDYTYIWNPISMAKIDIGQLNDAYLFKKCVMSKPPSEPDCRLVFSAMNGYDRAFLQLVDDDTIIQKYLPDDDDTYRDEMLMSVVSFRGSIYGFLHPIRCFVVTIDFDNETVQFRPILKLDQQPWDLPWASREWAVLWDDHMIESPCGQELLLVRKMYVCQFSHDKFDFIVFQVDVDRKECVELDSIGDRAIFISHCGGDFCCSSSLDNTGIFRRNCIYYTVEQGMSRSVYVYDFNYRSTTLLLPCSAARLTRSANYWVERRVFGI